MTMTTFKKMKRQRSTVRAVHPVITARVLFNAIGRIGDGRTILANRRLDGFLLSRFHLFL